MSNSQLNVSKNGSRLDSFGNEERDGAEISWRELSYKIISKKNIKKRNCFNFCSKKSEIEPKDEEKVILHPFSGTVKANSLVAVMGSSGAGKTTFLNALAHQLEGGVKEGSVYLNNRKLTKTYFRKTCGYVRQNDILLPNITVKETLTFYANMLLPMTMPIAEKENCVISTMQKLGLSHCQNTIIGNDFRRGISGGEKRRVSIAIELLKNPVVLFLDEPTSGLDSKTALNLINTLSELAHEYNHTIICTIHQPRSQIFTEFDSLLLLAKGYPVYFGAANNAIEYFGKKGFPCPDFENPADYFIDLLTVDNDSEELSAQSTERINFLIEQSKPEIESQNKILSQSEIGEKGKEVSSFGTFFLYQIWLLFRRSITNTLRDQQYLFGRVAQTLIMSVGVSILWWQMDTDQSSIQDRISVLFIVLLGSAFTEGQIASLIFPMERMVYLREKRSGMYRVFSYYIGKQIAELPLQLIIPTIFIVAVYLCVGLQYSLVHFGNLLLICLLLNFIMNSCGFFFGAVFEAQIAALLMPVCLVFAMLFAGFYVNTDNVPVFLKWAKYASMFYYSFSGVLYSEFWGREFYCRDDQLITMSEEATCSNGEVITVTSSACPITHGQQTIELFGADELTLYQLELILLAYLLIFRIALYFALLKPPKKV